MEEPFLGLEHVYTTDDQALKEHIVEDITEDGLVTLSGSEDACLDSPICRLPHGPIEFDHGVVVGLHYLDLPLCSFHHLQYALLNLKPFCQRVVMQ